MVIETDPEGRLSSDLRTGHGERIRVVRYDDRNDLVPIVEDPLGAVRAAAGDAFEGTSIEGLREEALETAEREAREDLGG